MPNAPKDTAPALDTAPSLADIFDRAASGVYDRDDAEDTDESEATSPEVPTAETDEDGMLEDPAPEEEEQEEDAEDDDEEGDPPASPPPVKPVALDSDPIFTIEAEDGTEIPITRSEAKKGYLRQRDYTQKTMAAAELRKSAEQEREAYKSVVAGIKQHYDGILQGEPDWAKVKEESPEQYATLRLEWQDARSARDQAAAVLQQEQARDQQMLVERIAQATQEEGDKLVAALPHWKDRAVAAKEVRLLREFLVSKGFDEAEIAQFRDHRAILVIRDALLYRQSRERAKAKITPAPKKTLRPGTTRSRRAEERQSLSGAQKRLAKSGDIHDAADVFANMPGLL